jgi:hypothetical protein
MGRHGINDLVAHHNAFIKALAAKPIVLSRRR